ncbi:hypothetical protein GXM_02779 [Nostoc sphaeroides CCNUC1]|uniref:Uncharacterized protein n=1 Tax=Nostoc sphaeroides CCNUC1 TaxID=2653204 RepID=A0A5P8VY12_9NOSO|nr:hypothetical protein GXM_02779 [Nostoc sphaeroides CCNUC1]
MTKSLPITKFIAIINNNYVMSWGLILPPNYTILGLVVCPINFAGL